MSNTLTRPDSRTVRAQVSSGFTHGLKMGAAGLGIVGAALAFDAKGASAMGTRIFGIISSVFKDVPEINGFSGKVAFFGDFLGSISSTLIGKQEDPSASLLRTLVTEGGLGGIHGAGANVGRT